MSDALSPDDLRELYQDLILDHGKHPRNFHRMEDAHCEAIGHNPLCGDKIILYVKVGNDQCIADVSFHGEGCAISMASASMMTDILIGKTAKQARQLLEYFGAVCTQDDALAALLKEGIEEEDLDRLTALSGVRHYPMRVKCATLAWRTLELALSPEGSQKNGAA